MGWLTGNNAAAGTICRRVLIPADINLRAAVNGALTSLIEEDNWEAFGTLTPAECAALMSAMYDAFLTDTCECPAEPKMIGTLFPYVTTALPTGCLECDGATYLKADYPDLSAALDSAFSVNATQFKVPDLRGRTIIGAGTGTGLTARAVGSNGGAENHGLSIAEMPSHTHAQNAHNHGLNDPGHGHFTNNPTHTHGLTDPGHGHVTNNPTHTHGLSDPGHGHTIAGRNSTADGVGAARLALNVAATTLNNTSNTTTGIAINAAATTVSVNNNTTGASVNAVATTVSVNNNTTGVSLNNAQPTIQFTGGVEAHNNMQPFLALKYAIVALP